MMSSIGDPAMGTGGGSGPGSAALSGFVIAGSGEVKTQFMTREGLYKLVPLAEYARPNRLGPPGSASGVSIGGGGYSLSGHPGLGPPPGSGGGPGNSGAGSATGGTSNAPPPVRVSFSKDVANSKIAFNYGREIFVYPYRGLRKATDLTKHIDKHTYKGTCPTCHDFGNQDNIPPSLTGSARDLKSVSCGSDDVVPLLIGFTQGQIQLIDPVRKDISKLFNEERLIEKSRVTCLKWLPGSPPNKLFLVSFTSGNMYLFNRDLQCLPIAPVYQSFKQGEGYAIFTCKTKTTRNPLYKWQVGHGAINQFSFSPCGHFLATVSQDGYMRLFNYDNMELHGCARSYFGGFTCVCWSPDGKYIACGGEDDLVTVYSVADNRIVVRGQGHRSWVTQVSFDEFNLSYGDVPDGLDFSGSDEDGASNNSLNNILINGSGSATSKRLTMPEDNGHDHIACYRLGSIGEDSHLCLWDLTEDILTRAKLGHSSSHDRLLHASLTSSHSRSHQHSNSISSKDSGLSSLDNNGLSSNSTTVSVSTASISNTSATSSSEKTSLTQRLAALNFGDKNKEHKRNFSLPGKSSNSAIVNPTGAVADQSSSSTPLGSRKHEYVKIGSPQCPKINEVPIIEPLINKKISQERLTSLTFLEECIVTACQEGYICTWARPDRFSSGNYASNMRCPGSPHQSSGGGGGTIV